MHKRLIFRDLMVSGGLLPEQLLAKQEHLFLVWVQLAWKLLKPAAILRIWLPDDVMRRKAMRPAFQWLERTGELLEKRYCGGDSFEADITGKELVSWKKN
ncbi:MAG: hypothetical protein R3B47_20245 [Bacteroidia bacterium]